MAFKLFLALLVLSSVATAGIWYTVYNENSFKVDVTVRDVQRVGDEIQMNVIFRMANSQNRAVFIDRVLVTVYTDSSKSVTITSFSMYSIQVDAGQTVERSQPVTLSNIDAAGKSVYAVIDISGSSGSDRFTQHVEREVALPGAA